MAAAKGTRPPAAGIGRRKGTKNKITRDVKDMILAALEHVGNDTYLAQQARENPVAFLALLGRILPLKHTGEDGGPVVLRWEQ